MLGVKGYFRALQKHCFRMEHRPRPPHEEAIVWFAMAANIRLPAVRAVCEALQLMDEQSSQQEYAALRSELFRWVDLICADLSVDRDDWTHPEPWPRIKLRWAAVRQATSVMKHLCSLFPSLNTRDDNCF